MLIKLTDSKTGIIITINSNSIDSIFPVANGNKDLYTNQINYDKAYTSVVVNTLRYSVSETPQEILQLIKNAN